MRDHLVTVDWAEPVDGPALRALLVPEERDRVARLQRPADRARFVTGRALLRTRAAAVVGATPREIAVHLRCERCGGPHGKPRVDGLEVSLAHAGERVLLAWRRRGAVGVDVEPRGAAVRGLADQVLAAGEDGEDLLTTWVRKEAVLKLRGVGLSEPMTGVRLDAAGLHLTDLDVGPDHVAAVASGDPSAVVVRRIRLPTPSP